MALALTVGVLVGGGVYMILRRGMLRVIVGFLLITHAVNLLLIMAGGVDRRTPAIGRVFDLTHAADPLPQAFVLTAVVIAFAVSMFMLVLAVIGDGDDDTELDLSGRADETPDLLPESHPAYRPHAPENWHAYLDRADDLPDTDSEPEQTPEADHGARTR